MDAVIRTDPRNVTPRAATVAHLGQVRVAIEAHLDMDLFRPKQAEAEPERTELADVQQRAGEFLGSE